MTCRSGSRGFEFLAYPPLANLYPLTLWMIIEPARRRCVAERFRCAGQESARSAQRPRRPPERSTVNAASQQSPPDKELARVFLSNRAQSLFSGLNPRLARG